MEGTLGRRSRVSEWKARIRVNDDDDKGKG
jgi:hypothetical protein